MKKWSLIFTAVLLGAWLARDEVRDFRANDTIQYFLSEPKRWFYIAAIAVAGGLAAFAFDRLSARAKQRVTIVTLGAITSTLTVSIAWFAVRFAFHSSPIVESGSTAWVLLLLLFFSVLAALFWFGFYRTMKAESHMR